VTSTFTTLSRRAATALTVVVAVGSAAPAGFQALLRADADRFQAKIEAITRHAEKPAPGPLVTRVTELEVNAYLACDAVDQLPAGFREPRVTVLADLSLSGTATIDLDAIKAQRQSRGWLDPLNYLGGTLSIGVAARLQATEGFARLSLLSAKVGGIPVPKVVVQELLTYYSRSESRPNGLNLDDPYPLPARIREIEIRPGEAVVKQ
jgi:hypothetical protein